MPLQEVKTMLADVLSLGSSADALTEQSPLLGAIPELDSMAVVQLIAAMEEQFGFSVDDDEIDAATFASVGSLDAFIRHKLTA
jgi:acyl carrier protein